MKEEYSSLQKNDTWELVDLPAGINLVKCKWVYKTKFVADGSPFKYKEKMVDKGYSQVQGIYYNDTFAPVVLHKNSFGHCSFKGKGGATHGCEMCLYTWRYE